MRTKDRGSHVVGKQQLITLSVMNFCRSYCYTHKAMCVGALSWMKGILILALSLLKWQNNKVVWHVTVFLSSNYRLLIFLSNILIKVWTFMVIFTVKQHHTVVIFGVWEFNSLNCKGNCLNTFGELESQIQKFWILHIHSSKNGKFAPPPPITYSEAKHYQHLFWQ